MKQEVLEQLAGGALPEPGRDVWIYLLRGDVPYVIAELIVSDTRPPFWLDEGGTVYDQGEVIAWEHIQPEPQSHEAARDG